MAAQPKFTPGPWEAVLDNDPRGQPSCMYRGLIAMVERGDRTLAVVLGNGHRYDNVPQEQWAPNAHLISAAPDLYAALEAAEALLKLHGYPAFKNSDSIRAQARAALRKADGDA